MAATETINRAMATSAANIIAGQAGWDKHYILLSLLPWFPLRNVNTLEASLARC